MKLLIQLVLFIILPFSCLWAQNTDWLPVQELNSTYNEFSPTMSPDGTFMIFSSRREGGLGDNDLWISYFTNGKWQPPENLRNLNTSFQDHEPFLTYDGTALLFSSDRDGGYGAGDLYVSFRNGKDWSAPENMGPVINSENSEKMPSLSMDNHELFFSRIPVDYAARKLRSEEIQIWHSWETGGIWSLPEKLPPPVNMLSGDCAPRIMPDNKTLLFASQREGGFGGYDIWSVKRNGPDMDWYGLTNLIMLNTPGNDAYFTFTIDQQKLYVSRQALGKKDFDIYEYTVKEEISNPTITLQGRITNTADGKPIEAELIVESATNGGEQFTINSAPKTGQYSVSLPKGGQYLITMEVEGFMFHSEMLDLTELPASRVVKRDIGLQPLKAGFNFIINTIYFDGDSYVLRKESFPTLDRIAELMKDNPNLRILVKGHVAEVEGYSKTDSQVLSEQRANAVKGYIVQKGISGDRMETKGFGGTQPIGDNKTEQGRQLNRRTEFEILGEKK
jgi:outer membrane protein OmpA-like peptidoglycan-associated protein